MFRSAHVTVVTLRIGGFRSWQIFIEVSDDPIASLLFGSNFNELTRNE